jgi:hypothetical protein
MDIQARGGEQHVADGVAGRVWLTCCAWCARIEVMESWVENAAALELISASGTCEPVLTHGICPACFRQVSARAAGERQHVDERIGGLQTAELGVYTLVDEVDGEASSRSNR